MKSKSKAPISNAEPQVAESRPTRAGRASVTLVDVARVAGVSKVTAARALSSPALVTPETQQRVRDAVVATGYVPNLIAGGLRSNRTRLIACLVPTIASGSAFLVAVHAMTEAFTDAGYQVMLGERGYDPSREERLVDAIVARRPDGIVVTGVMASEAARAKLRSAGVPVVETWDMTKTPIDMLVGFSHVKVGEAIAKYFHGLGRRRVAMITTREPRGEKRAQGFLKAAQKLGMAASIAEVPTYEGGAPSRMKHGREGLAHLLENHPEIDALYCASDLIALGALVEARARGLDVPSRLAVVGFGDLDFAVDTDPPLTTVHVDGLAIGRQAAACIIARIEGTDGASTVHDLGFSLITRGSA